MSACNRVLWGTRSHRPGTSETGEASRSLGRAGLRLAAGVLRPFDGLAEIFISGIESLGRRARRRDRFRPNVLPVSVAVSMQASLGSVVATGCITVVIVTDNPTSVASQPVFQLEFDARHLAVFRCERRAKLHAVGHPIRRWRDLVVRHSSSHTTSCSSSKKSGCYSLSNGFEYA